VMQDLEAIARSVRERRSDVLLVIDAISSMSCVDVQMDAWDLDVVLSASQKGWMVPPGLALVGVGPRAWRAHRDSKLPSFYWDFELARTYLAKAQTPWTPPIPIYHGLAVSLRRMRAEGLRSIFGRHATVAAGVRAGVQALGLELFAAAGVRSDTVTAIRAPRGVSLQNLIDRLRRDDDVIIAGGQGALAGEIFRIGHLGWVEQDDIVQCLSALGRQLAALGLASSPQLRPGQGRP